MVRSLAVLALVALLALTALPVAAAPQTDEEAAYLSILDILFTSAIHTTSGCEATYTDRGDQDACVLGGYEAIRAYWEPLPVPRRYTSMNTAFGRWFGNLEATMQVVAKLTAETAGGDGTYDPYVALADLNRLKQLNANQLMAPFYDAFLREAGYGPGHAAID